ncbi:hypothetical protein V6N13_029445 [Hibiscus sabdariffa]
MLHGMRRGRIYMCIILFDWVLILLNTWEVISGQKFSSWQSEPSFEGMLRNTWTDNVPLLSNVANFNEQVMNWNMNKFSHIEKRKRILMARIDGVERALDKSNRPRLIEYCPRPGEKSLVSTGSNITD